MELMDVFKAVTGGAGIMDVVKSAFGDKESKEKTAEPGKKPETGNSIFNWLSEQLGFKDKAKGIQENAENERKSIFEGVWDSVLARYYPTLSKLKDLKNPVKIYESIKANPLNIIEEMDHILADTLFIPDSVLKYVTDPLVHTDIFRKIVETYTNAFHGVLTPDIPLLNRIPIVGPEKQNWVEKIYGSANYDPDDVISFLRIILKDKNILQAVVQKII